MMVYEIILSGFGGQGVMLMGQLLTQAGLEEGKEVSWIPSYGPEMRGGTAYCSVKISDVLIGSPVVTHPNVVVAMNLPSLHKFEKLLVPGGTMIINESLAPERSERTDIRQLSSPLNELAVELNNSKVINLIGLGAILAAVAPVSEEALFKAMNRIFGKKFAEKPQLLELNKQAFQTGYSYVEKSE